MILIQVDRKEATRARLQRSTSFLSERIGVRLRTNGVVHRGHVGRTSDVDAERIRDQRPGNDPLETNWNVGTPFVRSAAALAS